MSHTFDVNVLVYASNVQAPEHEGALRLLERIGQGSDVVFAFWPVLVGYVRVVTLAGLLQRPLSLEQALANVDGLLGLPNVRTASESSRFGGVLREVATEAQAGGKLIHDAHIVALMRENGVRTIWTRDRDFRRFDGIRVVDPFG